MLSGLFVSSCNAQDQDIIILNVTNRSGGAIDSIIIPYKKIAIKQPLAADKSIAIKMDIGDLKNSNREGVIPFFIFRNNKKFFGHFGFHDWGVFPKKAESVYVFDNGINFKDEPIPKPTYLTLFLIPKTSFGIDSIKVAPSILKKKNIEKNYTELVLDFELFEKEPEIKLYQKGRAYTLKVEHDWNNWNNNQEIIYVYEEGVFSKKEM